MEDIHERLSLFEKLIQCGYSIYLWSFKPQVELVHTTCPYSLADIQFPTMKEDLMKLDFSKIRFDRPIIYSNDLGILWIADFESENGELKYTHVIGPMSTGKNSLQEIRKKLYEKDIEVAKKIKITNLIDSVSIVPSNLLYQYTFMLHYCITGEYITISDIQYPSMQGSIADTESIDQISDEHRGVWQAEQELLEAFRHGSQDYEQKIRNSSFLSSGVKADYSDSMDKAKTNIIVFLTLCSRASMEGGLSPAIGYSMFDIYLQQIENASTFSELTLISKAFTHEYISRVQKTHVNQELSGPIANCLDYIDMHVRENIDLKELASMFGYTDYYFSKKFKQEMHIGINEYIRKCKLEQAKTLLKTTDLSIQEINETVSFGTRSYFTECFKKAYGMSPQDYRNQKTSDL